jgi:putative transposon-encoded protein
MRLPWYSKEQIQIAFENVVGKLGTSASVVVPRHSHYGIDLLFSPLTGAD